MLLKLWKVLIPTGRTYSISFHIRNLTKLISMLKIGMRNLYIGYVSYYPSFPHKKVLPSIIIPKFDDDFFVLCNKFVFNYYFYKDLPSFRYLLKAGNSCYSIQNNKIKSLHGVPNGVQLYPRSRKNEVT